MSEERERADNDSPWKEILEAYFPQAMQFFFPQTAALINWERPHEFLDKEFQQIVREAEFWQEFKQFEQERTMSYITTGERIGYERGKEEGQQEQAQTLVLRLLQKRVGELPQQVREQIQGLSLEQLEALGEALLDFGAIADLLNWLQTHQTVSTES
jgi:flagellar biosynthesis/type III secretory pathway protein FliH